MAKTISIIGGCGHVGIPLGLALASKGHKLFLVDINQKAVDAINNKKLPFIEEGAEEILDQVVSKNLFATTDVTKVSQSDIVFFVTGTPVDEHHNPKVHEVVKVIESYLPYLNPKQTVILRSTVYPGVIDIVDNVFKKKWGTSKLAFCPERILQGKGIEEIFKLPQIISATSPAAEEEAISLFKTVTPKIVKLQPIEAEFAKLMTNAWRYLEFAIANQFYMMAESQGLDFHRIFDGLRDDYPRAANFAKPGLAAGPCLFKDTMQLSAFHKNNFFLGQSAMLINEGLPVFLVDQLEEKMGSLKDKKIALLGMTFKANNDDIRESLSFKMKKVLEMKMATVLPSDPYLSDSLPLKEALATADGVLLGVPHREYLQLKVEKPYIDCWGIWH